MGRLSPGDVVVGHGRVVLTTTRVLAGMGHAATTIALIAAVVFEAYRAVICRFTEQLYLADGGTFIMLVLVAVVLMAPLTGSLTGPFTATFAAFAIRVGAVAPSFLGRVGLPAVIALSGVVPIAGTG